MIEFQEAHKGFITHLQNKDSARSTILAYGKDIQQLLDFVKDELSKTQVQSIERSDIQGFLDYLEKSGFTPKTISRKINSTKTFFRFLKISEYITDDPATLISHPKFETPPPRILTETEYRALRDAAKGDARTYAIIEILLQTGIRIGELSEISLDSFQIDEASHGGQLEIATSRVTLERKIPLNEAVIRAIQEYLKVRPVVEDRHLLVTRNGKPLAIRNMRAAVKRYLRLAKIEDASVNDLRHTWIAHHIKRGASLILVSRLAGHKRIATTERYLQYVEPREKKSELAVL
ncbi:tyrosine-type recombinase/integrase [Patescibacteria group bacterium]|nr:tyrosine-type recombinase/integrase [Patescibacteria group bacterium]